MFNYLFNKSKDDKSAQIAKRRLLQVVVSEHHNQHNVDLHALQQDVVKVLLKYYQHIDLDQVKVELTREEGYSILGLDVTLPDQPS